eukprot:gene8390-9289_t
MDDKTRAALVAFYERGMTITLMSEKIEAAAAETVLSIDKIKITILEQLGVESANILIDENNDVSYYGPQRGIDCLNSNSNIDFQFRKYFEPTQKEFTYSYQDLQNLFKKEYAKAINSKVAKVAYLKGGFAIQGIPEDVEWKSKDGKFKRLCDYGQKDINKIMQVKENIKFIIMANPSEISLPGCIFKLVDERLID